MNKMLTRLIALGALLTASGLTVNSVSADTGVTSASTSSVQSAPVAKATKAATNTPKYSKPGAAKYSTVIKSGYQVYASLGGNGSVAAGKTNQYVNKTFKIVNIATYSKYTYYQLETESGKTIGYVNKNALANVTGAQGHAFKTSGYYTVMSKNARIYKSFNLSKSTSIGKYYHTTLRAKIKYNHLNGRTYLSLYTYKNGWVGYVNAAYLAQGKYGRMGAVIKANHYATINSKSYKIYWNLKWKARTTSKAQYHKTFKVTGQYNANDGNVYEGLRTADNKFYGYVNSKAILKRYVPQGAAIKVSKKVELTSTSAQIWKNFTGTKSTKKASAYKNQPLTAKVMYSYVNGRQYFSLYTKNNGWVGYVNVKSTKTYVAPKPTKPRWLRPSEDKPYPNLKKYPKAYFSVSQEKQRVYIKAANGKTLYTMICSTGLGHNTPNGWYKIQAERGLAFSGANYWTSWLNHGQYLFHTVIVNHDRSYNVAAAKLLGHKASHGCIRLPVPDAKWIYKNAPVGMRVHIY